MDTRLKGETTYKVIKTEERLEKTNPELYEKIILYNKTALKLEKARAMTLISQIREEELEDIDSLDVKYPNVLSEQGEMLCEALEHQCDDLKKEIKQYIKEKKEREEIERRKKEEEEREKRGDVQDGVQEEAQAEEVYQYETFEEDYCKNAEFDREDFLKNNAETIIKNLEDNNQIDEERKKHELKNLKKALEYNEDDYKRRVRELLYKKIQRYPKGSTNYELFNKMLLDFHNMMIHNCSIEKLSQMYTLVKANSMEDITDFLKDNNLAR